jgi:hypothetical protein
MNASYVPHRQHALPKFERICDNRPHRHARQHRKDIKNRPLPAKNECTAFALITTVGERLDEFGFINVSGERESGGIDSGSL